MECLLLRLDAPLMSFGGVVVDQINPVDRFPGRSMITGLVGNALGWDHADAVQLAELQERLRHAARWDALPERLMDYHTVDLGQPFMVDTGWTTRGRREDRGSGAATSGTHQRYRHYWANGCATVAIALMGDGTAAADLSAIESALRTPARPLFLGRKTCMPATPVLLGWREAEGLRAALAAEPLADIGPRRRPERVEACWPIDEGEGAQTIELADLRDWRHNVHRGAQCHAVGFLELTR
jgi:CRISPR system Cascade subunit CasD